MKRVQSTVTDGGQTITTVSIGFYYEQITTSGAVTTTDWIKVLITCEAFSVGWYYFEVESQYRLA
jgi:hypothetical protein